MSLVSGIAGGGGTTGLQSSSSNPWEDWFANNTLYGNIISPKGTLHTPFKAKQDQRASFYEKGIIQNDAGEKTDHAIAALDVFEKNIIIAGHFKRLGASDRNIEMMLMSNSGKAETMGDPEIEEWAKISGIWDKFKGESGISNRHKLDKAFVKSLGYDPLNYSQSGVQGRAEADYFKNYTSSLFPRLKSLNDKNLHAGIKILENYGGFDQTLTEGKYYDSKGVLTTGYGKYKRLDRQHLDFLIGQELSIKKSFEEKFEKTLGPDWRNSPKLAEWMAMEETQEYLGTTPGNNLIKAISGESKYNETMSKLTEADRRGSYSNDTQDFGNITFVADKKKPGGFNMFDLFKGGGNLIFDIGKFAVETVIDGATAAFDWTIDIAEAIDDLGEGKDFWSTMGDTAKKVAGIDVFEDAYNKMNSGDYAGALMKFNEFGSEFGSDTLPPDIQKNLQAAFLDNMEELTSENEDLAKLRNKVNETFGDLTGMGPIEEPELPGDIKMKPIEAKTLEELKTLLGIMPGPGTDPDVIPGLIGTEARKMAEDPDIARMRELQGQVAETGYDAGEREALSAKARRELAGMARQQGFAAGAAAGGLRGASVGAQARSLAEQAMQKQADVTTEMDKASIARKDTARQQLARLAQDVSKFDIEKEQERKKRKGATTIGVQSLLQQEELGKQQMQLAMQE